MTPSYSLLKSRTFWSLVVLFLYNGFTSLIPVFPNVAWITIIVNALGFISISYFHQQTGNSTTGTN